jgi:PAS domain S-box-containing protein
MQRDHRNKRDAGVPAAPPAARFRLLRYFTMASLAAFLLAAAPLLYFERRENDLFKQMQQEQSAFFAQMQNSFVQRHDAAAPAYLLQLYEAGNVNLARLFANSLWDKDFTPFVTKAQAIRVDQCRAIADVKDAAGKTVQPAGKQACYADIGKQIMALSEFQALDAKLFDLVKKSTVFRIKMYDLRGITVYSSEHNQIGEDKRDNAVWKSAMAGKPASQLTSRGKFSAFKGEVTDRDLISSYVPVLAPGSEKIAAVFEVYSDVAQFFGQIKSTSSEIRELSAASRAQLERAEAANRGKVVESMNLQYAIALGLLALLYCALFLIVRNGQRIIDKEKVEIERAEKALRAAEEQFRGLVEQSIAGIYIIQDGKLIYVNPRCAEILGQGSTDELISSDPLRWVAESDRGKVAENMRRLLGGEAQSIAMDFGVLRRDGVVIQVGANAARATHEGRPAIIGLLQDISEKKRAEEQIQHYTQQLETAFMSTVEVTTNLSEMRDAYTAGHARRVGEIAVAIGAELGFDARRQEGLRVAGYLHDIGKISVPTEILCKPGKLNLIEFQLIQGHAQASYDVLKGVEFPWPVAEVARQHHERIDGSGYPQGLKGEAILLEARIMAVADVVEAMSSHRPYRSGLGIEKALAEIERGSGIIYDAQVAAACLKLFREQGFTIPA